MSNTITITSNKIKKHLDFLKSNWISEKIDLNLLMHCEIIRSISALESLSFLVCSVGFLLL